MEVDKMKRRIDSLLTVCITITNEILEEMRQRSLLRGNENKELLLYNQFSGEVKGFYIEHGKFKGLLNIQPATDGVKMYYHHSKNTTLIKLTDVDNEIKKKIREFLKQMPYSIPINLKKEENLHKEEFIRVLGSVTFGVNSFISSKMYVFLLDIHTKNEISEALQYKRYKIKKALREIDSDIYLIRILNSYFVWVKGEMVVYCFYEKEHAVMQYKKKIIELYSKYIVEDTKDM